MDDSDKYPEIVYKYRSWHDENHRNILLKNQLFLSSPGDFNDPFDCRIPINYTLLDTPEKIQKYIDEFLSRHQNTLMRRGADIEIMANVIRDSLNNHNDEVQRTNEEQLYKDQDEHYGVLSLSKRWNSILMWSHYGNFHKGFCVGFVEEKLRKSGVFGKGGPVNYNINDDYPAISPLNEQSSIEKSLIETHYKARDWHYEEEYRLTRLFFPNRPTNSDRIIQFDDSYFAEIILGIQVLQQDKEQIMVIAKEKKIPIYQAVKVPFKFLMDRIELT